MTFQAAAKVTLADSQQRRNLAKATTLIREKRLRAVSELPDWEELREAGEAIKARAMATLPEQLERLEAAVTRAGGTVHWARDGAEANAIVAGMAREHGADEVIKVKSLATDEIGMNEALGGQGITPIETDLAELIVQLGHDKQSHILVPAIHRNRAEIRSLFERTIAQGQSLGTEARAIAEAARVHLRSKFLSVPVAVSGANFGVAETGTIGVVESEGNGRMCTTLPRVLITLMGIEKVLPEWRDLEVFLQLLPRSSTAERMNPYTSLWTGVRAGDGPREFHLVLLDGGRTYVLADEVGRQALHCIRCSACLNVCPVYERVGGQAYESVYPGPIGAILTPQLRGLGEAPTLPWASSLCGACYEACPVKIDIPTVLVHLRGRVVREEKSKLTPEALAMKGMAAAFGSRRRYEARAAPGPPGPRPARGRRPPGLDRDARPAGAPQGDVPRLVAQRERARRHPRPHQRRARRRRRRRRSRATIASPARSPRDGVVDLFCERAAEYQATVTRVPPSSPPRSARRSATRRTSPSPPGSTSPRAAVTTRRSPLKSSKRSTPSSPAPRSRSPTPARSSWTAAPSPAAARSRSCPTITCASCARRRSSRPCPTRWPRSPRPRARAARSRSCPARPPRATSSSTASRACTAPAGSTSSSLKKPKGVMFDHREGSWVGGGSASPWSRPPSWGSRARHRPRARRRS